jgi:hypothetical protein
MTLSLFRSARLAALVLACAVMLAIVAPVLAFAADAVTDATKVVLPWGDLVGQWAQAIAWSLASLALVLLHKLPGNVVALFGNARVELLLTNAIGYGINAVAGAAKGKVLEVDVGNKVLKEAVQYAVDNSPGWLQSWAGGPEGLAKKIWGRLNLGEGADASAISTALSLLQVKP